VSRVPLYDALAADYDRFVDWEGRLAHELPFFVRFVEQSASEGRQVRRVLDAACGTGHHAIALAGRGYQVVGADLSAPMIERARDNAATAGVEVTFAVAGLGQLSSLEKTFDAVLCLGNSLPHLLTAAAVEAALADFAAVLRPGGLLILQNRNFDRVCTEQERFMAPQSYEDGDGEWLFLRFYDFHEETITFNMVRLHRTQKTWTQTVEATELRPLFHDELAAALIRAGFDRLVAYGGCDGSAFDPARSGDLIAVTSKRAETASSHR
jgi:glycine/sarcosine N-methyltransferase